MIIILFLQWLFFALAAFIFFPILIFGGAGWWGFIKTASRTLKGESSFRMFDTVMIFFGMVIYAPYLIWAGDSFFMTKTSGAGTVIAYLINLSPILMGVTLLVRRFLLTLKRPVAVDPTQTVVALEPDHRAPPPAV
jgi:hypothetical protein